jgi:hypothetical protein
VILAPVLCPLKQGVGEEVGEIRGENRGKRQVIRGNEGLNILPFAPQNLNKKLQRPPLR